MLKEHISIFRRIEMLIDIGLAVIAFYIGSPFTGYTPILPAFIVVWIVLLYLSGVYESFRMKSFVDMIITLWAAAFIGTGLFGCVAYFFNIEGLNRAFVILIFFGAAALTSIVKFLSMAFFRNIRKKGYNYRNILVVGTGPRAEEFIELVKVRDEWGLKIVGVIDEDGSMKGQELNGHTVIGSLEEVADIVTNTVVDEIVFCVPRTWFPKMEKIIPFCELTGIRVHIAIDVFNFKYSKPKQTALENYLLLTFDQTPIKAGQLFLKNVFDRVVSGIFLIILSPVYIIVPILIKLTSKGPALYSQTRCGLNGRTFKLYKFRTMVVNAEEMLEELKDKNEMSGPVFKMKDDPRITPIGKWLRKFSIDELPQFWNVFTGDMSLVGPRPPLPHEVKNYDSWQRRRLSMRPGITCLWQVQGRNKITNFNEWTRLDLQYIDKWSIWGDIRILLMTVPTVILGIGAK